MTFFAVTFVDTLKLQPVISPVTLNVHAVMLARLMALTEISGLRWSLTRLRVGVLCVVGSC